MGKKRAASCVLLPGEEPTSYAFISKAGRTAKA